MGRIGGEDIATFWRIAKWVFIAAAVAYLAKAGMFSWDRFRLSRGDWAWCLACAVVFALVIAGAALRFHFLLRTLGCGSEWRAQLRLFYGGLFLQMVGSNFAFDAMRALLMRRGGMAGGMIATSLLADRLLGLTASLFFGFSGLLLLFEPGRYLTVLAISAALAIAAPLAPIGWRRLVSSGKCGRLASLPGSAFVSAMGESFLLLARRPGPLLTLQAMAIAIAFASFFCIYLAAAALGVGITLTECVIGGAIANLVTVLPLPITGLGLGESVFGGVVAGLRDSGQIVDFAPAFFLMRMISLVVGLAAWFAVLPGGGMTKTRTEDSSGLEPRTQAGEN